MELEPYPLRDAFRDFRGAARQYRHPLNIAREAVRVGGEWTVRRKGGRR
jgi:hypothetical protein